MRTEIAEVRAAKEEHRVARERAGQDTRDKVCCLEMAQAMSRILPRLSDQGQILALTVLSRPESGFDFLAKAIFWPCLSHQGHVLALTVLCVPRCARPRRSTALHGSARDRTPAIRYVA